MGNYEKTQKHETLMSKWFNHFNLTDKIKKEPINRQATVHKIKTVEPLGVSGTLCQGFWERGKGESGTVAGGFGNSVVNEK